ncbi:MAG: InlB B-repeat-containing protein [Clostridia bacterium]|nr:InlB B-repeat-containing protein [Clostridia bacterium]
MKRIKSFLAVLLAFAFILTATPLSGFAAEVADNGETTVTQPEANENETPEAEESAKEYTVTYYSNGKKYGDIQTYKAGETIQPPQAPEAEEGHIFNGWVINENQDKLPETMPENNLEASASWKLKDVNITFVSDGTEVKKATVPFGSSVEETVPVDPEKEGYKFAGWFDENGKNVYEYKTVPSSDLSFTAKWLKNANVTYMMSKDKSYAAYEVTEGDKIPVPEKNPEKFAHKFVGWSPEIPDVMPAEDLVFEAQYEVDKDFVTVLIGGVLIAGGAIGLTAAAITGLSIVGGIIAVIGLSSIVGNITKTYKVTFKVDGSVYKIYNVEAGKKITVPDDPEKEGYDFAGWTPDIPDEMPKNDLTFEAKWSSKDTDIPDTGSSAAGLAAFAALTVSAAAAVLLIKKKKDK